LKEKAKINMKENLNQENMKEYIQVKRKEK
jgi:hypothetical protein